MRVLHPTRELGKLNCYTMSAHGKASAEHSDYGDVRAEIDVDALNAFLIINAPEIATPVTVKQFSVRPRFTAHALVATAYNVSPPVQFGQVQSLLSIHI